MNSRLIHYIKKIYSKLVYFICDSLLLTVAPRDKVEDYTDNYSRLYLEIIIENIPAFIFWKDTESVYLGCNQLFAEFVGKNNPSEVIGKTDFDLNWGDGEPEKFIIIDQNVMRGNPIYNLEERLNRTGDLNVVMLVSKVALIDKNNRCIGMLGVSMDITKLKETEEKLVIVSEQAKMANRSKSAFIANISHDVKVPLSGIIGLSSIMEKDKKQCTMNNAKLIHDAGSELLIMMNKILNFVKLESPDLRALQKEEVFSITAMVNDIVILFTPILNTKKIALKVILSEDIPHHVLLKANYFHKILINLISNAVKFTEEGEIKIKIDFNTSKEKMWLCVSVMDTGIGIPQDKRELIFEWFERLTPAYKGHYQGTGLGLAMVKQSVNALQGSIRVESNSPHGSNFICEIPVKIPEDVEASQVNQSYVEQSTIDEITQLSQNKIADTTELNMLANSEPSYGNNQKLLLIEDDHTAGVAAKLLLKSMGYQVTWVLDGEKGVKEALTKLYDIIITDIGLPGISGIDVLTQCREGHVACPIYALTGHGDIDLIQKENFKFTQVMRKPLDLNLLKQYILEQETLTTKSVLAIIDLNEGEEILGEQAAAEELLCSFINNLTKAVQDIHQAIEQKNIVELRKILHQLLGAASYASVPELTHVMQEIQAIIKLNETDATQHLAEIFVPFFDAVKRLYAIAKQCNYLG